MVEGNLGGDFATVLLAIHDPETGSLCDRVYEWFGQRWLAESADWLLAKPVAIATILVIAFVIRFVLHRLIRRLAHRAAEGTVPGVLAKGKGHKILEASPLLRGTRLQLHWHEHEPFRFASAPDHAQDETFNRNLARLPERGLLFELQVFPNQLDSALKLVEAHPDLTFVLIHAGMPIAGEPWRDALTQLAQRPNVCVKLSGQGTFVHRVDPELIADVTKVVLDAFGSGRAMFGSNFPIESLWTDFSSLMDAWLGVLAEYPGEVRADVLSRTARRIYRLQEVQG